MEKLRSKLSPYKGLVMLLFALTQFLPLVGQEWKMGKAALLPGAANTVMRAGSIGSKYSLSFLGSVGGVDFQKIARPASDFSFESISIAYNPENKNSHRLEVTIDGETYTPYLPDWQLVPIAEYADSKHTGAVSLFGEQGTWLRFHIVYHEAFKDELLGMRLLQADMMLMNPESLWELPSLNGKAIIGVGEMKYGDSIMASMKKNAIKIDKLKKNVIESTSKEPTSWVYTDQANTIEFSVVNNKFSIGGWPYHYFWKHKDDNEEEFEDLKKLTQTMKRNRITIYKMNPYVFDAASFTSQYSAFFRYIKKYYPTNWKSFMEQVDDAEYDHARNTNAKDPIKTPVYTPKYYE
ncbi:MAG: hypothetical protein AAGF85_03900 [Bacteroidota bacterium]